MTGADKAVAKKIVWGCRTRPVPFVVSTKGRKIVMQTTLELRTADTSGLVAMNQFEQSGTQTRDAAVERPHSKPVHKGRGKTWTGRIVSGLAVAFLLFDAIPKILQLSWVVKASTQMGFPAAAIQPIGLVLLACTVVYCIPRTAILGAVLLTGYLGGAVEANVQAGNPLLSHTLFPIYFAVIIWGGLALRDRRVWSMFARRSP
jgi:hypothetical protein